MTALAALAALALQGIPPPAEAPPPAERLRVRTLAGRLAEVSLSPGRVAIEGGDGKVSLTVDRNTVVYLESRQGTVRDLAVGQAVRAAAGAQGQAYWVEVVAGSPGTTPAPEPAAAPPPKDQSR